MILGISQKHPSFHLLATGPTSYQIGFRPAPLNQRLLTPITPIPLVSANAIPLQPLQGSQHLNFHIDNPHAPVLPPSVLVTTDTMDVAEDPPGDPPTADPNQPYVHPPITILSKKASEAFFKSLPTNTQLRLDESFGKEKITHSFSTDCMFRHVVIFLLKSGFLSSTCTLVLQTTSIHVSTMSLLLRRYGCVDFTPLRGYQQSWHQRKELSQERRAMTTACLLHYNLDIPTVVRFLGGPHVASLRDVPHILRTVKPILNPTLFQSLARILTTGTPAYCVAHSSEANYTAYRDYGNHRMLPPQKDKLRLSLLKEETRGFLFLAHNILSRFVYNCHITPYGVVVKPGKKDRPFSDASFHPEVDSMGINDWTSKNDELPVIFPASETAYFRELYNLRITYPRDELVQGDDDVQGAFKHLRISPNLVGMHAFLFDSNLGFNTSQIFGGETCPLNWEIMARCRQQLAQHLFQTPDIVARAAPYLPPLEFTPPPSPDDISQFALATRDSKNPGASYTGYGPSPSFFHHVDDNMYATLQHSMARALSASVVSLYELLGYPTTLTPDPLSRDKLHTTYSHQRRLLGKDVDSRRLMVSLPSDKRQATLTLLHEWLQKHHFTILELAKLIGIMESNATLCRWAKADYFVLLNCLRTQLRTTYHVVVRKVKATKKYDLLKVRLPLHLATRLVSVIARDIAALLWKTHTPISMTSDIHQCLQEHYDYMVDPTNPWEIPIAYLIDRDHSFLCTGDASELSVGAYSLDFTFWTCIDYDLSLRARFSLKPSNPLYMHINLFEFVILVVQLAAAITRWEAQQPTNVTAYPKIKLLSDNTTSISWASKISSKKLGGQALVRVWAALLKRTTLDVEIVHLPGISNTTADAISRPDANSCSLIALRLPKLIQIEPALASWTFFRPSPMLLSTMAFALSSPSNLVAINLPEELGRFEVVDSTTSASALVPVLRLPSALSSTPPILCTTTTPFS